MLEVIILFLKMNQDLWSVHDVAHDMKMLDKGGVMNDRD
jgi:hypothetical protein